ncbi:MAG: hypothetical protein U9R60_07325, partial [Bacteroidota bacterium]|nr:hypothetical protein [Bacteroidota bacterium]
MKPLSLFLALCLLSSFALTQESHYLPGFTHKIKGQDLDYHSPHVDVGLSLLVRSDDSSAYIEWNAQPISPDYLMDYAEYIMMIGIDVNPEDRHQFDFYINDELFFILANPDDTLQNPVFKSFNKNVQLRFHKLLVDKYGDLMGYLYLKVPRERFSNGKALNIKVKGEHAGSMSWFMVFQKSIMPECK